ncbi:ArsA-related P-loop ATPase [Luteipulveratus sp. YIM 133132]|uniref:ArsA-related P-loop ATPase n=1 Tax=Luteipulveratus flavus TaxID=3031728 RepID=UPI0023AEBB49|nr:ArsA-related P-loop ATPase [Luteipulveratus sp. YIM 133132]MDE9365738.1 ArsA-related P-loop ATPase [Luteipulveratus sp. YIM 133132]
MSDRRPTSSDWAGVRLHIVSGKGGTGKTTVAAALAMALATEGSRVLLVEVEARQGISQTFDVPQLGEEERRVARGLHGGEVVGLSVDAKAALMEYLQMFYKLGRAGGMLERFGVVDFATTIAPGVRDVLLIGKVYEAVGRREGKRRGGDRTYDAVVLDAPPTGRIGRFLNVNHEVAGLAKVGPVRQQADSITRLLQSPQTVVHLVTLLEEMPVQETIDAAADLERIGMRVGAIIVNQEREPLLRPQAVATLREDPDGTTLLEKDLGSAGLRVGPVLTGGLVQTGLDLGDRLELEAQERAEIARLERPTYHLPLLRDGLDAGGLRELADALAGQGICANQDESEGTAG